MKKLTAILGVLVLGTVVGCLGGGGADKACEAHLSYNGKEFDATGKGEAYAQESACLGYCSNVDETVDAAYQAWKSSPKGEKSTMSRFGEVDLDSELRALRDACAKTCNADIGSGNAEITFKCP